MNATFSRDFHVDGRYRHPHMALLCLRLMNAKLHYNICEFSDPFTLYEEMQLEHPNDRSRGYISEALRYACTHWLMHLAQTNPSDEGYEAIMEAFKEFLFTAETDRDGRPSRGNHLIHWIEALSILGEVHRAKTSMRALLEWSKVWNANH